MSKNIRKKLISKADEERRHIQSLVDKQLNRMENKIFGRGSYATGINGQGSYGAALGKLAGKSIGGAIGGKRGKKIGKHLGSLGGGMAEKYGTNVAANLLLGSGTYETIGNKTMTGVSTSTVPTFGIEHDESGKIYMVFTEFIGNVYSPAVANTLQVTQYSVNPGLPAVFPWLSQIATNYEKYRLDGCVFTFVPDTGLVTSGSMGFVVLAPQYNASSPKPITISQIKMLDGSVTGKLIDRVVCGIECDPSVMDSPSSFYVRAGAVPAGQDIKTYDKCNINIGLYGVNATAFPVGTSVGELHVSYKMELSFPKLWDALGNAIPTDSFFGLTGTNVLPLSRTVSTSGRNTIGGTMDITGTSMYTFPDAFEGTVSVTYWVNGNNLGGLDGSNLTENASSTTIVANDLLTADGTSNTNSIFSEGNGEATVIKTFTVSKAIVSQSNTITFSLPGSGSSTNTFVIVTAYNPLLGAPTGGASNWFVLS